MTGGSNKNPQPAQNPLIPKKTVKFDKDTKDPKKDNNPKAPKKTQELKNGKSYLWIINILYYFSDSWRNISVQSGWAHIHDY